jgi:hypothetical protein
MNITTTRNGRRLLYLLGLAVLAPVLMGPKPPPPPPDPEPPTITSCDELTDDFDLDQDGLPDKVDCEGLSTGLNGPANGGLIDYLGCFDNPGAVPDCTDYTLADLFAEVHKDTSVGGISGFDDVAELGTAISDDEIFSFAENSLPVNVHVLPPGSFGAQYRIVWQGTGRSQAGVILVENASVGTGCPSVPLTTGISLLNNANEFGQFEVFSRRIFQKIDCLGADPSLKRLHFLNTCSHELAHTMRQAPDPSSYHQQTVGDWVMEASIEPDRRDRLTVPTGFHANSHATILAGTTTQGPTICGDTTTFDLDDDPNIEDPAAENLPEIFACLPKMAP